MRNPFSRVFSRFTVSVCSDCEGGSGAFYNASTGELTRCARCSGTGLDAATDPVHVFDLALARSARAKEQRRVA